MFLLDGALLLLFQLTNHHVGSHFCELFAHARIHRIDIFCCHSSSWLILHEGVDAVNLEASHLANG